MNQLLLLFAGALGIAAFAGLMNRDDDGGDDEPEVPDLPEVLGDDSSEELTGTNEDEIVRSFDGDDTVDGRGGDDWIFTGRGDDQVIHDPGNDHVFLGDGDDQYDWSTDDYEADGDDTIEGGSGSDTIWASAGNDLILAGDDDDEGDWLDGGSGSDTIYGGAGNDTIQGGADRDADTLIGGEGDDLLLVREDDYADGGEGNDTYTFYISRTSGTSPVDAIIEYGEEDRVQIEYSASDGRPEVELIQEGEDAKLLVNGILQATLLSTSAATVQVDFNALR